MTQKRKNACGLLALTAVILLPGKLTTAHADAMGQAKQAIQAVCDLNLVSYSHRDLSGTMVMYAPTYQETNVVERTYDYREVLAGFAADFASRHLYIGNRATIRSVVLHGITANVFIDWHFSSRSSAFTHSRDYSERSVWKHGSNGWKEIRAQITRDVSVYQRIP